MHVREVVGAFDLGAISYRMVRRLDNPAAVWVEGPAPQYDHRYALKIHSHGDPTHLAVWVEVVGLVCFPGRFGVDIGGLIE